MVAPSLTYFQLLLEFLNVVYWPTHFSALVWTGFWGGCRDVKISDLDFTHDAVIFAETMDILLWALEVLIEESEPLGFWVSWVVVVVWQLSCRGSYHFLKCDCVADAVPLYQYTHELVLISPTSEG